MAITSSATVSKDKPTHGYGKLKKPKYRGGKPRQQQDWGESKSKRRRRGI